MHMISKKDLSEAEMDTLTKSCSPTIVIIANGDVQTHEEAIVYVKELDIFLTMKVLDNTPAVLSLGKLCDENGYFHEWIDGQKPHLIKDGNSDNLQHGEFRSNRGSRLVKFFLGTFINFKDTYETGESFFFFFFFFFLLLLLLLLLLLFFFFFFFFFFILTFFTHSRRNFGSRKGRCT